MNSRLSEGNVLRTAKKILGFAGLAALALACATPTCPQSKPSQTDPAATPSNASASGTLPSVQASSDTAPAQISAMKTTQSLTQNSPAKSPAPKGQHEGITVHGHWTIEVRNPDGKLVTRREFENALDSTTGGALLMALMLGQNSSGAWAIGLAPTLNSIAGTLCNSPYTIAIGLPPDLPVLQSCTLAQSGDQYFEPCGEKDGCFQGLTVTTPTPTLQNVTLSGQLTAETSGTISTVFTMLMSCNPSVAPAACPTTPQPAPAPLTSFPPLLVQQASGATNLSGVYPFGIPLTVASFAAPGSCGGTNQPPCQVSVQAQQVVSVTVQISFSGVPYIVE
jgi:hypothetical protein